ncbi:MBL fold metallo-hydrolase [Arenibacter palladensis]|uniref:MBL fold metallo-hydrolase n=1 Tax=Arenibacter palladensis TaxID=237373 RepID=UPI002FD0E496
MDLLLIRNATIKLTYAGKVFLIDPYLGKKFSQPSFAGFSKNPMVDLPISIQEILSGVDMVLVSHCHPDHFDRTAEVTIAKDTPIGCQPEELNILISMGFTKVRAMESQFTFGDISLTRTIGQHGHGDRLTMMGTVSGFIFQHKSEPTLYWLGDTVLNDSIKENIINFNPNILVTHSCGALWSKNEFSVIMDEKQTVEVCALAPKAKIIATHMETLDLATITRKELRVYANNYGISDSQLLIPLDGEKLTFNLE